jgi:hypothetical protein
MNVLEAQQENFLPDSIKDKAEEYMTWWTTEYGKNHEYPIIDNPEEIGWAKDLIQSVLTSFKPDYSRKENEFNEVTLKRHLTHAKSWFDGIPTRTVHSMDGPWKVRIAWFVGIAIDFILAKEKKLISGEVINEVDKYLDWWSSLGNEEGQHITTREEIDRANKVVDRVLESLN